MRERAALQLTSLRLVPSLALALCCQAGQPSMFNQCGEGEHETKPGWPMVALAVRPYRTCRHARMVTQLYLNHGRGKVLCQDQQGYAPTACQSQTWALSNARPNASSDSRWAGTEHSPAPAHESGLLALDSGGFA
eukprot:3320107-Amphidinium_carterae.1